MRRKDMTKLFSRALLVLYLLFLAWLVLFKLTFNFSTLLTYHHRSLNLVPFAAPSIVNGKINYGEMIGNCLFFIPFGVLLNVNFKKVSFLRKLSSVFLFSLAAETIQYIFAIGASDITDVITNTLGGFLGLEFYSLSNKYIRDKKLDRVIISVGTLLLALLIFIRVNHHFARR